MEFSNSQSLKNFAGFAYIHTQIQYLQFSIYFVFHQIALVCIGPEVDENHYLAQF